MPTTGNLIELTSASKSFGNQSILHEINLAIPPGQLVVVLGANGAGKTTLLRILAGLLGLDAGELKITGSPLDRLSEKQREKIFFLPDFPALFDDLTVLENIEIWLALYGQEAAELEEESFALLERFDLASSSELPAAVLSRGQRFKLALTCYEGSKAPIGLFDEPFASGMDASGLREMKKLIRNAVANQRSVLYTTQLVTYALEFADRILVIHDAGIHFDGSPETFLNQLKNGDPVLETFSETEA
ncbi:ABC transporter ATP-binding protein [Verrucomicrobiaceae bacterium 227]